jgi:hypothetical protein
MVSSPKSPASQSKIPPESRQLSDEELIKRFLADGPPPDTSGLGGPGLPRIMGPLHNNSPQVNPADAANYRDGAKAGGFIIPGLANEFVDGKEGFTCVICGEIPNYVEWLPNRGGYAGRYAVDALPKDLEYQTVARGGREQRAMVRRSSGNVLEFSLELFLVVDALPFIWSCNNASRLRFAREWSVKYRFLRDPVSGGRLPSYAHQYRIRSYPVSNSFGSWFSPTAEDLGLLRDEQTYLVAKSLGAFVREGGNLLDTAAPALALPAA